MISFNLYSYTLLSFQLILFCELLHWIISDMEFMLILNWNRKFHVFVFFIEVKKRCFRKQNFSDIDVAHRYCSHVHKKSWWSHVSIGHSLRCLLRSHRIIFTIIHERLTCLKIPYQISDIQNSSTNIMISISFIRYKTKTSRRQFK